MDRSYFRRSPRDTSPLLPQNSFPLTELPPRPYSDTNTESVSSQSQASTTSPPSSHRPRVKFLSPPPPITSTVLIRPPALSSRSLPATQIPAPTNPLAALTRREKALQADLQRFLDAQSESLVSDRLSRQHGSSTVSEAGSTTPTSHSPTGRQDRGRSRNGAVVPVRQPRPKKLTLVGSRFGIIGAMQELASVKAHTLSILRSESETLRTQLACVDTWEEKISGLEMEMRRIEGGGDERETVDLQAERSAIENEIRELEDRLLRLRARDRHLGKRLAEASNRRESEMSSFREGKREVEEEVSRFLGRPPRLDVVLSVVAEKEKEARGEGEGILFLTLPSKRRTLTMARDWLTYCLKSVSSYIASTETEKEALEEGALMWESTVELVTVFENELREQMQEGHDIGVEDVQRQLQKMDKIIDSLEGTSRVAAERGWNLLICAVGAELEAFNEGKGVLRGILGESGDIEQGDNGDQKNSSALAGSGLAREPFVSTATKNHNNANNQDQGDDISSHIDFGAEVRNEDHSHDADSDTVPPILLDGLQTTLVPKIDEDDELQTPTAPPRRDGAGARAGIGVGHARSVSQIYSLSSGHNLLLSHSLRDKERNREPSPYRSESEDDGPPAALLVGLQDDDFE